MKPITQEWIEKAEGDWRAAQSLYRVRKDPNFDVICYLTQQSVEKYLKACLEEGGLAFPKTHDLPHLLRLTVQLQPLLSCLQHQAVNLNNYTVDFRYPGKSATKAQAKQAIQDCREARRVIRTAFGLPV
jgi:HEPN domain-containing protein